MTHALQEFQIVLSGEVYFVLSFFSLPVKEVFRRLLNIVQSNSEANNSSANTTSSSSASRLSAVDIFVGFHKIESDLKAAIAAVNVCVADETVFNESVMAVSLTQMLEMKSLPTLIMRTVLQARKSVLYAQWIQFFSKKDFSKELFTSEGIVY